jgi:Domain of unknown function (DUF4384)
MKSLLALAVLVPAVVWSQEKPSLNARELFYSEPQPPPPAKPPANPGKNPGKGKRQPPKPQAQPGAHTVAAAAVPLGLRYALLRRDEAGRFQEVPPDTTFHSGDRIRIKVDVNSSGYLYVVTQGSSGTWTLLFPSKQVDGGSNHVQKGEPRQIPPGDQGQFAFDEKAGTEKLFIVLTRQPQPDLDKLIYAVGGTKSAEPASDHMMLAQTTLPDSVISRLHQQLASRDLIFEAVNSASAETDGKMEKAAYVVNKDTSADARLVVDVALSHR